MNNFRKVVALFVFILLLIPFNFVLAAPLSGGYLPGASLDPDCTPGASDCTVNFSAEALSSTSIAGSLIFSDGDNDSNRLGIGTNSPDSSLELVGDFLITGNIIPSADDTYSLGPSSMQWKDVFIGPSSLYINGQKVIEEELNNIIFSADVNQSVALRTTGTGDIEAVLNSSVNSTVDFIYKFLATITPVY